MRENLRLFSGKSSNVMWKICDFFAASKCISHETNLLQRTQDHFNSLRECVVPNHLFVVLSFGSLYGMSTIPPNEKTMLFTNMYISGDCIYPFLWKDFP